MSVTQAPASPLLLTEHPLQRCGAWAVTVLADRERVEQVTAELLDGVTARIVEDVVEAAVAEKSGGAYHWWKVLFALYPNSKPTHAKREKDRTALREEMARLFGPDDLGGPVWACTFCDQPSGVLWAKTTLPMFDSIRAVNTLPPATAGWPVCRGCRVALWALPYGAWLTAGSATVLTCDNPQVERQFARRNIQRADRIRQLGFDSLPATAGPEAVTLQALREHASDAPAATNLWMFKNDNQEPWLLVSGTRTGVARFVHLLMADPDCRRGWRDLRRALARRDRQGKAAVDGATAAARLLFDREGGQSDRLPMELWARSADLEKTPRPTLVGRRALCRLYMEVMFEMDVDRIKPVAELLATWIAQESHRGRFNTYGKAAGSGYELHKVLTTAQKRLYLDSKDQRVFSEVIGDLLTSGSQGWRERTVLFFEVIEALHRKGVTMGAPGGENEEDSSEDNSETKFDGNDDGEEHA